MRKDALNTETLEGRLYSFDIAKKTVQNKESKNFGQPFWSGTLNIATDEEGLNIVPVHYTYVTETFSSGNKDSRFAAFEKINSEGKTWEKDGKDAATKLRLTPSAALNDFFPQGQDKPVSAPRNEGGFITFINGELKPEEARNKFVFDMVILKVAHIVPEDESPDYASIKGVIFDYNKAVLPFEVVAKEANAIEYFLNLGVSQASPVFTQVWGTICSTTKNISREVENAFGPPSVEITTRTVREWVVTGARVQPYGFGDEKMSITGEELKSKFADRTLRLEEIKARSEAYYNSRKNAMVTTTTPSTPPTSPIPAGNFNGFGDGFGFGV